MADRVTAIRNLIAAQPGQSHSTNDYLQRVCQTAARTLSASGTGISVLTDNGVRGVCAASDPHSERIEELQFVLGEGPCIDAFDSRRPVLIPDLAHDAAARWPMYGPAAHDSGVRAVFAFPLQMGAARLGVLDVFREHPGALSGAQLSDAMTFADLTLEALLDQHEATSDVDTDDGVADAVGYRAELFQAQGMVMVQIGGTLSEAMARMRAYAYAESRGLGDVAHDVVARRLQFDRDHR
ncbi:GAF and ANTAR domain-containing protein [Plantactinospora soyae]|uniref:GAF domain-containing protein n=1 Tax=Plantactinospora soyae TaxID=1544732 RepID=A0A927M3S8_9ACTN|nr:GAF and ANTAR domain-containing protein [Plantactinospora soyae]MBE1486281.1 GAF domain-containing protein [Plantactinospora soyae]